ncbi:BTB/POZ domain-containing protein 3/6 [Mytilus galloprovincialis]|uniref:BTB/POZ domain-containing protein 3/6 n=1 Tax=Mytilus galloprovincialis TaxID=29158 RepID=A0A8B6EBQ6_MYTGA|nr:BTB/POZ domain-containing protein 3/6 [Mytilus galloprovincialis]
MTTHDGEEKDWQSGRSIAECNRYMFAHQLGCDVTFLVGNDSNPIPAHKYVLASRSSVFFAMFYGAVAETNDEIQIPDIEPEVFSTLLKYLYYEDLAVSGEQTASLMYAANKYCVTKVVRKCRKLLQEALTVDTVCSTMESAHLFDDHELHKKCLEMILLEPQKCLQSEAFLHLCPDCLMPIISSDDLIIDEATVLNVLLKWAETECRRQQLTVCDVNIKNVLGKVLYEVRFPVMDIQFFADKVGKRDILSKSERISVFTFLCGSSKSIPDDLFKTTPRGQRQLQTTIALQDPQTPQNTHTPQQRICLRFLRDGHVALRNENLWYVGQKSDKIDFSASKTIYIHGIILYGCGVESASYTVEATILRAGLSTTNLSKIHTKVTVNKEKTFNIFFPKSIYIVPNIRYTITVIMQGPRTYWGEGGEEHVTSDGVKFEFSKTIGETNGTDTDHGQIPGLIFSK